MSKDSLTELIFPNRFLSYSKDAPKELTNRSEDDISSILQPLNQIFYSQGAVESGSQSTAHKMQGTTYEVHLIDQKNNLFIANRYSGIDEPKIFTGIASYSRKGVPLEIIQDLRKFYDTNTNNEKHNDRIIHFGFSESDVENNPDLRRHLSKFMPIFEYLTK